MKKVISLLLATTCLVLAISSCGGNPVITTGNSATTDASGGTSSTITDPAIDHSLKPGTIEFEPVTSSTDNAIAIEEYKENIKNLIIGDTYTHTDGTVYTVYSVGIGPGYKVCREYDYSLESLVVRGGKTKKIESYSFQNSTNLVSVTLGEGVESIGDLAFFGCGNLETLSLPSTLTTIGGSAFQGASSLTEVVIPSSVTSIGNSAFAGCTSLTKVTLPSRFNDQAMLKDIFLSNYKNIQFVFVD